MNFKATLLIFLFFAIPSQAYHCHADNSQKENSHWITIFVHGIKSIQPFLCADNVLLFFTDQVKDTPYAQAVKIARQDSFFYRNQAMQGLGLQKIDTGDLRKNNASAAIAQIYDEVTKMVTPHHITHYYTYGWSGLLSPSARYEEAEGLLLAIRAELQKFAAMGITPKIRLIGYSHGVNVCMNLAAIKNNKYPDTDFVIDEFILLGGPIQLDTDYLINDPIFKCVYNIFSQKDRIQPIDFFSFNRLFSRKKFKSRRTFRLNKKVVQIDMRVTRTRETRCLDTKERYIATTSNLCIPGVISGRHELLRDMSPGHIELWFFEWSPRHYRSYFPLAPLPVLAYVPYFLFHAKRLKHCTKHSHTVIVDIRPEHNQLIVQHEGCRSCIVQAPFVSYDKRKQLAEIANKVRPDKCSLEEYNQHLYDAIEKAKIIFYERHGCD